MKRISLLLTISVILLGTLAISQDRSTPVQPVRLDAMRNIAFDSGQSGLPVVLPHDWGKLMSVQKIEGNGYALFLQNDAGEIYLVRLVQQGNQLYLDSYDHGGLAQVIKRN